MAKPNIKAKALLNKDFNNFCIIHANDDIQYKITKKLAIARIFTVLFIFIAPLKQMILSLVYNVYQ